MNVPQSKSAASPRHVQAARASWFAPLIAIFLNLVFGVNAGNRAVSVAVGCIAAGIIVIGFCFAVWAIAGAFTKGPRRILLPAVIGLLLNGLLIFAAIDTFSHVKRIAEERRSEQELADSGNWIPQGSAWYVNRAEYFAIRFPVGWELIPNPKDDIAVIALSPQESDADAFRENMVVATGRVSRQTDPKTLWSNELHELRRDTQGYEQYAAGQRTIDGVEWFWVTYRQVVQGVESRMTAYRAIQAGRGYTVFCTRRPDSAETMTAKFDEAIDSIRIPH
jgi:hypothetical protein